MRRYLNEAMHVLIFFTVLQVGSKVQADATIKKHVLEYITKHGFATSHEIVAQLKGLLSPPNKPWVVRALQLTVGLVGFHPRTGYQCPPVEDPTRGTDKIVALVDYLFGNFSIWLANTKSISAAIADLPFKTVEFQAYQVEMDLAWFDAYNGYLRSNTIHRRRVTGPGMLPLGLRLSPHTFYGCNDDTVAIEGDREDEPPAKRCYVTSYHKISKMTLSNEIAFAMLLALQMYQPRVMWELGQKRHLQSDQWRWGTMEKNIVGVNWTDLYLVPRVEGLNDHHCLLKSVHLTRVVCAR